jgi:hypothetical protein
VGAGPVDEILFDDLTLNMDKIPNYYIFDQQSKAQISKYVTAIKVAKRNIIKPPKLTSSFRSVVGYEETEDKGHKYPTSIQNPLWAGIRSLLHKPATSDSPALIEIIRNFMLDFHRSFEIHIKGILQVKFSNENGDIKLKLETYKRDSNTPNKPKFIKVLSAKNMKSAKTLAEWIGKTFGDLIPWLRSVGLSIIAADLHDCVTHMSGDRNSLMYGVLHLFVQ